ncbi:hypothetical protein HMPREF9370_0174 [Neisseria wadsworthii 9715]|uniref:Uncharacterized protein n=1 Tax=Neisseria wadsworthii 9715 TaxID=1030841 RepID=G4CM65_9NEIS|nr:hypothetical protein HMPREF9370_0174 [Neisseria wadsworthii 9715]
MLTQAQCLSEKPKSKPPENNLFGRFHYDSVYIASSSMRI